MQIKRSTLFIESSEGTIYVPRPDGWASGIIRHQWVTQHLGRKPFIASPQYWEILSEKFETKKLVEYESGPCVILEECSW